MNKKRIPQSNTRSDSWCVKPYDTYEQPVTFSTEFIDVFTQIIFCDQ
jgi:hypothetical protein